MRWRPVTRPWTKGDSCRSRSFMRFAVWRDVVTDIRHALHGTGNAQSTRYESVQSACQSMQIRVSNRLERKGRCVSSVGELRGCDVKPRMQAFDNANWLPTANSQCGLLLHRRLQRDAVPRRIDVAVQAQQVVAPTATRHARRRSQAYFIHARLLPSSGGCHAAHDPVPRI